MEEKFEDKWLFNWKDMKDFFIMGLILGLAVGITGFWFLTEIIR